jgi:hypothetical protein
LHAIRRRWNRASGSLATIGSAAPFIGLFGTVVGIMTSFQAIAGSQSTNLAVVAPGIAEALLATAIGLLAAIPAVIAYNKLTADAGKLTARMEGFADEFSAILSRQIDEKLQPRQAPSKALPSGATEAGHRFDHGYVSLEKASGGARPSDGGVAGTSR